MKNVIAILLFLFIILTNVLPHIGSAILAVFLLLWLVLLLTKKISQETSVGENWLIAGFLFYYGVNLFSFVVHGFSTDLYEPRSSHLDNELRMLSVIPLYFLMRQYKPDQRVLWYGLAVGAILCGTMAFYQLIFMGPGVRASGSYHAISFADLSMVMAFMVLSGWDYFRSQQKYLTLIPVVAFIFGIAATILSHSRGAWLAFPFLLVLFIWQFRKKVVPMLFIATTVIAIGVTAMVPGNPLAQRTQQAIDEVVAFSRGEMVWGGASARLELWKVAGDIIQNNLSLGVGQGAFKPILLAEISKGEVSSPLATLKEPHNIFLNAMVNSGLLGLLAVAICFIVPLYLLIGFLQKTIAGRSLAYAGIILVGSFLHFGLTESLFQRNIYINFYLVMLAFILSHLHPTCPSPPSKKRINPDVVLGFQLNQHEGESYGQKDKLPGTNHHKAT